MQEQLPKVRVVVDVPYGPEKERHPLGSPLATELNFYLPAGEYEAHHLSPWGPVITEVNGLGHQLIVDWEYCERGAEERLREAFTRPASESERRIRDFMANR